MRGVKPTKELIQFPYLVSPKIDGLRALVKDGVVYSKTMKPIPTRRVQELFGHLHGADAELTVGPA
jgi:DNA ligase 1